MNKKAKILGVLLLASIAPLTRGQLQDTKPQQADFRESAIYEPTGLLPECYRPSLLGLRDDVLACAWASGSGMDALDTAIRISFKSPGSGSWEPPVVVADEEGCPDNYPLLAELPDGRLRLFYATQYRDKRKHPPGAGMEAWHLKYRDSFDGGRTWGGEFFLVPESGRIPSGRMVRTGDGELILPLTDLPRRSSLFLSSEDGGGYWRDFFHFGETGGLIDPALVLTGPRELLAFLRPLENIHPGGFLWQAESRDNGRTWTKLQQSGLQNPCGPVELAKLAGGRLALVYNDHPDWLTFLAVAISEDGGRSWCHQRTITRGNWDNRDPTLVQTSDGRLHLVYVARNIYLKHVEFTESWVRKGDDDPSNGR